MLVTLVLCKRTQFTSGTVVCATRQVACREWRTSEKEQGKRQYKKEKKYRGWTRCDPKVCCGCVYIYLYLFIYIFLFFSAARFHLFAFAFIRIVARDMPGTYCFYTSLFLFFFFVQAMLCTGALYPQRTWYNSDSSQIICNVTVTPIMVKYNNKLMLLQYVYTVSAMNKGVRLGEFARTRC